MASICVKHLFLRLADGAIVCSCSLDKYKMCLDRLRNDYKCMEAMVSISPVVRNNNNQSLPGVVKSFSDELKNVGDALKNIDNYMDDLTKKGL